MPSRTLLMLLTFVMLAMPTYGASLHDNPCDGDTDPDFVQGSCGSCSWSGTTYSCGACTWAGANKTDASIDMTSCASCAVAVATAQSSAPSSAPSSASSGGAALYCADLKVEFTLQKKMDDPSKATIATTTQRNIETLVPVEYKFVIGGRTYESGQITSGTGQEITYFLGEAFRAAGYRFEGIKLLWKPPGAEAPGESVGHDGHSITLTDKGAPTGGYVFLFELSNIHDIGCRTGTIYRSPDPTIYNPPDTSPVGPGDPY